MPAGFAEGVLFITLYSVVGWICEVACCSILSRRFINRGFLHGPYCPIYGIGAAIILEITHPIRQYPALVFLVALGSVTILEYVTGWLMETIFQIKWWDYSDQKLNIRGRICLRNSLIFGAMGLAVVYLLHPLTSRLVGYLPVGQQNALASIVIAVFLLDFIYTLNSLLKLSEKLRTVQRYIAELEKCNEQYAWFQVGDLAGSIARLREICQNDDADQDLANLMDKLDAAMWKLGSTRLANAFPNLRPKGLGKSIERLMETWNRQAGPCRGASRWQRAWDAVKRYVRGTAAEVKETAISYADGLNFYNLLWVFVVAGVLGFLIETLYCLIASGKIVSRQGLIYGPFNQIYGFGAVLMVLMLTPLSRKNDRWVFVGGALIGGTFEFLCSLIQELVFGTISWEYSDWTFSIGGRTNLMYMVFWGALGLAFIKGIYPALSRLIRRIPRRQGVFFAWILMIILPLDMLLSAAAVYRWSQRVRDVPPANAYEVFLDTVYPNERLEEVYPNMILLGTKK